MIYQLKIRSIKNLFFKWIELLFQALIQGIVEVGYRVWAAPKLNVKNNENIVEKHS